MTYLSEAFSNSDKIPKLSRFTATVELETLKQLQSCPIKIRDRRGLDSMLVAFTITYTISRDGSKISS